MSPPITPGIQASPNTQSSGTRARSDMASLLKVVQPPTVKGEEKDCNKDVVNTFLLKWMDLHWFCNTLEFVCALQASLNFKGKAYKWWMSLM